jgi:hypothetical protein
MNKTQTKTFTRKDFTLNRLRVLFDNGIKRWKACRQIHYQVQDPENNIFMSSELDSLILILGPLCYRERYKPIKKYDLSNTVFEVDDYYFRDAESKKNEIRIEKLSEWFKDILKDNGVEFRVWIRRLKRNKFHVSSLLPSIARRLDKRDYNANAVGYVVPPTTMRSALDENNFETKYFPEGIINFISHKHPLGQWAFPINLPSWSDWVILFIAPQSIGSNNQLLKLVFNVEFLRYDFTLTQELIERLEAIAALVEDKFAELISGSSKQ